MLTAMKKGRRPAPAPPRRDLPSEYANWLKGKRCIIVGPAAYLKGKGLGEWIDSHDVVVKLNWGETLPAADYGSRTDVLYKRLLKLGHVDQILVDEYLAAGIQWLVAVDSAANVSHRQYIERTIAGRIPWFIDTSTRPALMRELGNAPLIGPISVRHLLAHRIASLTITGCDFYMSGYAAEYGGRPYREYMKRREGTIGPTHDGPRQLRWLIDQRKRDPRLQFDERLEELSRMPVVDKTTTQGVVAVIPARYESSRFPGKPLAEIAGKPMILHVCDRVARVVDSVIVATDDRRIADVVKSAGYRFVMTGEALTGTDRVAQAAVKLMASVIVNIQGDEPLVDPAAVLAVIEAAKKARAGVVVNAMTPLQPGEAESRDVVKAVVAKGGRLVYCSRAAVPSGRDGDGARWKQLGLYAFRKNELRAFSGAGRRTPLEVAEDVEILRFLEMGIPVQMVEVPAGSQAVDRPDDIAKVEAILAR